MNNLVPNKTTHLSPQDIQFLQSQIQADTYQDLIWVDPDYLSQVLDDFGNNSYYLQFKDSQLMIFNGDGSNNYHPVPLDKWDYINPMI